MTPKIDFKHRHALLKNIFKSHKGLLEKCRDLEKQRNIEHIYLTCSCYRNVFMHLHVYYYDLVFSMLKALVLLDNF